MKIERAAIADASRISALIRTLSNPFFVSPTGEGAEPFLISISESAIQGYVSASNFEYLVAKKEDQLAGVIALRDNSHPASRAPPLISNVGRHKALSEVIHAQQ